LFGPVTPPPTVPDPTRLRIDVWSDVICPWCHLGLTWLHQALDGFDHADGVDVVLRSYQLDPSAPVRDDVPLVTRLARKYGTTEDQVERSQERLRALGAEAGIDFRFDRTARGNTFDAHRLLHRADRHGLRPELEQRLFRAYFTEGEAVGDHDTLRRLAADVGLPAAEVDDVLAGDGHVADVGSDEDEARRRGITGVPFFLFDDDLGLPGAQDPDRMARVLRTVWADRHLAAPGGEDPPSTGGDGGRAGPEAAGRAEVGAEADLCGPEGCTG
jgi:predicted DsbA family dithiol-disulfide isomerase